MSANMEYPYKALGQKLRAARIRLKRTVAEASGAIEVNEDFLQKVEKGTKRPAEDTLMVLISYLELKEDEASSVWELAGYDDKEPAGPATVGTVDLGQPTASVLPGDLRVVYTDMVHVMVNDFGVIINFLQGVGPGNQPLAIARVGMSKEHARSVIDVLSKSLQQAERKPRQLKSSQKDSGTTGRKSQSSN